MEKRTVYDSWHQTSIGCLWTLYKKIIRKICKAKDISKVQNHFSAWFCNNVSKSRNRHFKIKIWLRVSVFYNESNYISQWQPTVYAWLRINLLSYWPSGRSFESSTNWLRIQSNIRELEAQSRYSTCFQNVITIIFTLQMPSWNIKCKSVLNVWIRYLQRINRHVHRARHAKIHELNRFLPRTTYQYPHKIQLNEWSEWTHPKGPHIST